MAYVISQLARRDGQSWPWLDDWGVTAFELALSGLCLLRGVLRRKGRAITLSLGTGLLAWSAGDLVLAIQSSGAGSPPPPSLADAFYLAFYPLTCVALVLLMRRQTKRLGITTWLDGAVAGAGAAALCAAFAFRHVLQYTGDGPWRIAISLAYPIGDLLLLGLVVAGSAVLPGRRKAPWLLLAVGYMLNALGDTSTLFHTGLGSVRVGTLLDAIAWPISIFLVSVSVWLRSSPTAEPLEDASPNFALTGLAACAALSILFLASLHHGSRIAVALAAATLVIAGVRAALSVLSLRQITEERRRQAITDLLTGLGNRRELFQLLDQFLPQSDSTEARPRQLAFLYVDLNGFKEINDSFGHLAGDELLQQLGARLKGSLRDSDLLVRLGGDEFGVAVVDADAEAAATVAERLTARLAEPFLVDAVRARISASIGIALAPTDATNVRDLLRCADLAMFRAKLAGKSFATYQRDLDGSGNRMQLLEELEAAIETREFELHYQPQVDLASGRIVSAEALVRWQHPRLGFVPPLEFLPLAEEAGLMGPLTAVVLDKGIAQCARWRAEGRELTVSINISASTLAEDGFPELVEQLLERHELSPAALVLEVTETTAIADFDRSKLVIERLRDLDAIVSVDDFGAGFTSLAYLSSLAVGELKLDRSFITGLSTADASRDLALVRSTIELAHALGLRVVAEGVEDNYALDLLADLGCDLAQGYLISRPKPAHELVLPPVREVGPAPSLAVGLDQFRGGGRPAPAAGAA